MARKVAVIDVVQTVHRSNIGEDIRDLGPQARRNRDHGYLFI